VWGHRSSDGTPLSCAARFDYETLSSIGMLIVAPEEQRKGRARELMRHLLEERPDKTSPVQLVAGTKAVTFYEALGFQSVESICKMAAEAPPAFQNIPQEKQMVSGPIDEAHFETLLNLDREVFGGNRGKVLKTRWEQAVKNVRLTNRQGTVLGFGSALLQDHQLLIGPVVAFNRFSAMKIIQELSRNHEGPVRMDVSGRDPAMRDIWQEAGFAIREQQPIMTLGGTPLPGRRDHLIALASQAWG